MESPERSGVSLRTWTIVIVVVCAIVMIATKYLVLQPENAGRHAVSSEELRKAMQAIGRSSPNDTAGGFDEAWLTRTDKQDIAKAAEATAKSALLIPGAVRTLGLDAEQKREFVKLANELHDHATELARHARHESMSSARESMNQMNTTCNECHTSFRVAPTTPSL